MMKLVVSNMEHLSENHRRRPSPSLYVGLAWPASVLISVLAIGQLVAASSSLATTNSNNRVADIKIENGWHEVREGWPTQDKDFFIATEKGHHYVEAQLPKNLKQDVMVSFEYYYSYAKTRPVLQLTPCRQNIYLVNENSDDQSNRWIKHTYRVKHSDCNARNKLAYNALLHDAGDVFAWKKMEIEYLPEGEASSAAPVNPNPVTTDKSTDVENEVAINDGSTDQVDTKKDTDTPKGTESAKSDEELYEEQADTQQEPKGAEERPKEAGPKERPKEEGPKERPEEEGPKERPEEEGPKERPEEEGPKERTEEEGPKERPEGEGPKERQEEEGPKETPNVDETAAAEKPTTSETESGQDKPATPSDERSGPQDSKAPQTNEERPKSPPPPPPPPKPQGSSSKVEWNTDKATTTTATTTTKVDSGSFQSEPEKTRPKVVKKIPADLKSPGDSSNPSSSKKDEPKPIEERTDSKVDSSKSSSDAESTSKVTTSTNNDYDDDQLINAAEISREEADKDPANGRPGMMRRKRSAKVAKSGAELKNKNKLLVSTDKPSNLRDSCKPSSCNRDKFRMSRFSGLINGLPWIPDKMKVAPFRYYVNLRNQPLKMRIRSFDQSLDEVDTCVNFWLYMEKDTKLEFLLENSSDPKREKLLELIERKAGDSTASHWDEFTRCISDYMPKYVSSSSASSHENTFDTLKFVLKPVKGQRPGQLVVLVNQNEVASFHELSRVQSHLPDLKRIADSKELERYWVFDRDGLKKVRMDLLTEKGLPGGRKVLRVSRIDPTQKYFDITSRWLRIKDAEILEHPVTFVYKAEQVDWIEQIDFQYQSVDDSEWRTHVAYLSSSREKEIEKEKAAAAAAKATNSKEAAATGDAGGNNAPAKPAETGGHDGYRFIDLPINLKHADSSEFRVRVRHYLKQKASPNQVQSSGSESGSGDLSLFIRSLAFADVCSYNNMVYCKNNGECKPTGAAQAECFCKPGYSGRYCEQVKPCEVHYGPGDSSVSSSVMGHREQMDGHQICKSLGAQCIDQLPVMRCEWPNDEYYECKKLFKFDSRTGLIVPGHKPSPGGTDGNGTGPGESSDDDSVLREKVKTLQEENNQQAKLIIILGVFLVALMVFAVVLIGSMVSRLRVSSGRLKKSQNEMHELARRVQPRGGGFSGSQQQQIGSVSRGGIAYNNSAFDVEL